MGGGFFWFSCFCFMVDMWRNVGWIKVVEGVDILFINWIMEVWVLDRWGRDFVDGILEVYGCICDRYSKVGFVIRVDMFL